MLSKINTYHITTGTWFIPTKKRSLDENTQTTQLQKHALGGNKKNNNKKCTRKEKYKHKFMSTFPKRNAHNIDK